VSFFIPREPPRVEFEHRGAEFKPRGETQAGTSNTSSGPGGQVVVVHRAHFSREMISELRSRASSSAGTSRSYTTLQCVVAHLWQCITKARRIDTDNTATEMHIAVNGRARMRHPQVPDGYTVNAVLWARPTATAGDLVAMPLRQVVELIRQEVSRIDDGYFRSFIDFATSGAAEKEGLAPSAICKDVLCPNVEVDSWLTFPFYELDFGTGSPSYFMPSYFPTEGMLFLVPSYIGDGSVDAFVPVFEHNLEAFKQCCYSME